MSSGTRENFWCMAREAMDQQRCGDSFPHVKRQEQQIRDELEAEIEKNLEEEIKDGIYNLTLKLHRLYQQRRERETASEGSSGRRNNNDKALSEVNISIKVEGETKIEIRETKKEANRPKSTLRNTKNRENLSKSPGSGREKMFHGTDKNIKEQMKNRLKVRELGWKW